MKQLKIIVLIMVLLLSTTTTVWASSKTVKKPTQVKKVAALANTPRTTITVTWKKVSGATTYQLYRATTKNGKYKKIATVKKTRYVDSKIKQGKPYYYKVRAVKTKQGKKYYGKYSSKIKNTNICDPDKVIKRVKAEVNYMKWCEDAEGEGLGFISYNTFTNDTTEDDIWIINKMAKDAHENGQRNYYKVTYAYEKYFNILTGKNDIRLVFYLWR